MDQEFLTYALITRVATEVETNSVARILADAGGVSGFDEWVRRRVLKKTQKGAGISRF